MDRILNVLGFYDPSHPAPYDKLLENLAICGLCKQTHQGQKDNIAKGWADKLQEFYRDSDLKGQEDSIPGTPTQHSKCPTQRENAPLSSLQDEIHALRQTIIQLQRRLDRLDHSGEYAESVSDSASRHSYTPTSRSEKTSVGLPEYMTPPATSSPSSSRHKSPFPVSDARGGHQRIRILQTPSECAESEGDTCSDAETVMYTPLSSWASWYSGREHVSQNGKLGKA